MNENEWVRCPICGNKTRDRIRVDTILCSSHRNIFFRYHAALLLQSQKQVQRYSLFSSSINQLGGQTASLYFVCTPGVSVSQVEDLLCLPSYTGCYLFKSLLAFSAIILIGRGTYHFVRRSFTHNGTIYTGFS